MLAFFSTVHVVLCIFMIFVILLQPGKDAGMGAALGGGAATSAFGGRGAVTFLGKVTAACAITYFVTSLGLSFVGLRQGLMTGKKAEAPASAPATPGTTPAAPATGAPAGNLEKSNGAPDAPKPTEKTPGTEGVPAENAPAPKK
jgi:preprotein translocase subunit SecG